MTIHRFASNSSGGRNLGISFGDTEVLVQCHDADSQERADALAARIASLPTLEHELICVRTERDQLRHTVGVLSGTNRTPSLFGTAFAREAGTGAVWLLGNLEKGWASFGFRFDSWEHLAKQRPEIRPCGVGADEHGPYVVMHATEADHITTGED